ncbi:MAG: hypothetical protein CL489_07050 [Acidobacteria bacterium]|nr:hypothetical protein [Acidobacteriota bacterium]
MVLVEQEIHLVLPQLKDLLVVQVPIPAAVKIILELAEVEVLAVLDKPETVIAMVMAVLELRMIIDQDSPHHTLEEEEVLLILVVKELLVTEGEQVQIQADQLKVFLELLIQVVVPVPGETVIKMAEVAAPEL